MLAMLATGSISDVCQLFQSDETGGVSGHDAFGDVVVGVLLQPSLSSTDHHQTTGSRTSAFLLKTLSQSRIVVCFGHNVFAGMKRMVSPGASSHRQVANSHIHARDSRVGFRCWLYYLYLKGDQQVEVFLGLVVPQFRS